MSEPNFRIIVPDGLEPRVKVVMLKGDTGEQGVKGKTGHSFRQYNGTIVADAPEGTKATIDMFKLSMFANVDDLIFDYYQNAQGNVEVRPWMVRSVNTDRYTADVQRWGSVIVIPRGARGEIGPQGERGPQGLPGDISNMKITPSMLSQDLQESSYPQAELVENLTWHDNTFAHPTVLYNLIGGMVDGYEFTGKVEPSETKDLVSTEMIIPATKTTYTLSFDAKSTVNGDKITSYFYNPNCVTSINGVPAGDMVDGNTQTTLTDSYKRYSITYTINPPKQVINVIVARLFGGVQGTVSIKNVRLMAGTDHNWTPIIEKIAYLDVKQGETYYARDLENNETWLNAPMLVTDADFNYISSIPAVADPDHSYKIEIPAGGTKLFLNSRVDLHPMLFKQTKFYSMGDSLDTIYHQFRYGKNPDATQDVALTHLRESKGHWNNAGLLQDTEEPLYACKPISVSPYQSFTITGHNYYGSCLAVVIDHKGRVITLITGDDGSDTYHQDYVFNIPKNGAYLLVNDNQISGATTTLKKVLSWK